MGKSLRVKKQRQHIEGPGGIDSQELALKTQYGGV